MEYVKDIKNVRVLSSPRLGYRNMSFAFMNLQNILNS